MVKITGIRFKRAGKIYFFDPGDLELKVGQKAIVETVRGVEMGDIVISGKMVQEEDVVQPLKKIMRVATEEDMRHAQENAAKEPRALEVCHEKVKAHSLPMKLVGAEYTFDNSKIIFYFTAEGRVDFRELVKDLASVFKMRIELRQIGVRDEAKLVGGLGPCGLPMCCTTWLGDFDPVSIKMAKEQNLSLNPAKISGICGRLMCCLKYESGMYDDAARQSRRRELAIKPAPPIICAAEPAPADAVVCIGCEQIIAGPDIAPEDEEGLLVAETESPIDCDELKAALAAAPAASNPAPFRPAPEAVPWKREKTRHHHATESQREPGKAVSNEERPQSAHPRRQQEQGRPIAGEPDKMQTHRRPDGLTDRPAPKGPISEKTSKQGWQEFQPREKQSVAPSGTESKPAAPAQDAGDKGPNFKSRRRRHGHRRPDGRPDGGSPPETK